MKMTKRNISQVGISGFRCYGLLPKKSTVLIIIVAIIFGIKNDVNAEGLPGKKNTIGYYYHYTATLYSPVLYSDMPYETMLHYIIADSILKSNEVVSYFNRIQDVPIDNDTLNYAIKYYYQLCDYAPIIFFKFWMTGGKSIISYKLSEGISERVLQMPNGRTKSLLLNSDYVLHIKVNKTEQHYNLLESFYGFNNMTIAYCQTLEKIKGQKLPDINSSILATTKNDSIVINYGSIDNSIEENIINNPTIDFIFDYYNDWEKHPMSADQIQWGLGSDGSPRNTAGMYDLNGDFWIKPSYEYIIFTAANFSYTDTTGQAYFHIWPLAGTSSRGLFPIGENGNVVDEMNFFGWGTSVPIETFKSNLQAIINEIKNYGE